MPLVWRPLQLREIARPVDNTHDLYAIFDDTIERNPTLYHKGPRTLPNLWPRPAKPRMIPQGIASRFDRVIDPIGDHRIVGSNPLPNIQQVPTRPACITDLARYFMILLRDAGAPLALARQNRFRPRRRSRFPHAMHFAANEVVRSMRRNASCTTSLEEA
jgi:hypothetical protein